MNGDKTFRRSPGRFVKVLSTFSLRSVSTGKTLHQDCFSASFQTILTIFSINFVLLIRLMFITPNTIVFYGYIHNYLYRDTISRWAANQSSKHLPEHKAWLYSAESQLSKWIFLSQLMKSTFYNRKQHLTIGVTFTVVHLFQLSIITLSNFKST